MVRHEMPFENLAFFLLGQGVEHRTQLPADVSEQSHFEWGLGSDAVLTLILPQGFHQTTWGGSYSGNGRTS